MTDGPRSGHQIPDAADAARSSVDGSSYGSEAGSDVPPSRRRSGDGGSRRPPSSGQRRDAPYLRLLAYYALLVAIASVLILYIPAVRQAFVAEIVLPATPGEAGELFTGAPTGAGAETVQGQPLGLEGILQRSLTVALIVVGALALVLPVAWVYMFTRKIQYDPSLVHSIIILPVVVAAVVVIVKNSLALAFSLAGIVAAVRFRTTVKDPKDAVYIFLAIGTGLAAGVQALDVALVMSVSFSLSILTLWKYDFGEIYTGGPGRNDILSIGDPGLLVAETSTQREEIRKELREFSEGMKTDGILLVHATDPDAARRAVEVSLHGRAKEWRFAEPVRIHDGLYTLRVLARLKSKKGDPLKVLGEIDERWHRHIAAAEFIPFKTKKSE